MNEVDEPASPWNEPSPEDEMALVRAVVGGDPQALERLHALYSEPLYRFVFYRLDGHVPDVEELVQESFLAALQSLHRFRGDSALFTWLCGIAKNHISRLRRRRGRERLADVLVASDSDIRGIVGRLETLDLPESALEREETEDLVGATMASLPISYQGVLVAKYVHALPVLEIARRQGSTPKAVESTLTRARIAFRRAFELLAGRWGGEVGNA
ncbi:MAG: RNA polymerase sigma factor [Planctomycetota bacterium]